MINSGRVVSYAIPARPVVSYGASLLLQRRGAPRLGTATPPTNHPQPTAVIFVFHIVAWELLQLKQACLIGGNLHKILMIALIYKLNVFTDEPGKAWSLE